MLRLLTSALPPPPKNSSNEELALSPKDEAIIGLLEHISKLRLRDISRSSLPRTFALNERASSDPPPRASPGFRNGTNPSIDVNWQVLDDEELAFSIFAQETAALSGFAESDDVLEELLEVEEMARYDHEMAVALSEGKEPPPRPASLDKGRRVFRGIDQWEIISALGSPSEESGSSDRDVLPSAPSQGRVPFGPSEKLAFNIPFPSDVFSDDEDDEDDAEARAAMHRRIDSLRKKMAGSESSTPPSPLHPPSEPLPPPPPPPPPPSCTICGDDIKGTIVRLDCGHTFDTGCVRDMFEKATVDEELFPPKCCRGALDIVDFGEHLDDALVDRFHKKAREFTTADRVYCHNARCAAFLGPATAEPATLECAECAAPGTCSCCKEQTHPGVPCHFPAEDAVLGLGKELGWQRCPSCKHLVELSIGCYHIVCRCSKQFCYVCGANWKECDCPLFFVPPEEDE